MHTIGDKRDVVLWVTLDDNPIFLKDWWCTWYPVVTPAIYRDKLPH